MLDKDTENKVSKLVQEELVNICKINKVDYFTLPKEIRDALVMAFQSGVGFLEKFQ